MIKPAKRLLALSSLALAIAASAAIGLGGASAQTPLTPEASASGAGGVTIGAKYRALRRRGLLGKIRRGCELGGPRTRSAPLVAPLMGNVSFTLKTPRRVANIDLRGGATARGVGVGSTVAQVQSAFPGSSVDHRTEPVFGLTLVKVPKPAGGKIQFAVDVDTGQVTSIGIPFIAFCE